MLNKEYIKNNCLKNYELIKMKKTIKLFKISDNKKFSLKIIFAQKYLKK